MRLKRIETVPGIRWLLVSLVFWFMAEPVTFSAPLMDADAFDKLKEHEKKQILIKKITDWLDKTKNLEATSCTLSYITKVNGVTPLPNAPKKSSSKLIATYKRISDDYCVKLNWWAGEKSDEMGSDVEETAGYSATNGEWKGFGTNPVLRERKHYTGRIGTAKSPLFSHGYKYGQMFDGSFTENLQFFLPYLIKYKDEIIFEKSERPGEIQIAVKNREPGMDDPLGVRRMWFDPKRDFFLTHLESDSRSDDGTFWAKRVLDVQKSQLLDNVWIPEKITIVELHAGLAPGMAAVHEITAKNIKLNKLTPSDLEVTIPPGTVVNDDIRCVQFVMGQKGSETPYNSIANGASKIEEKRGSLTLVLISLVVFGIVFAAVLIRKRKS